MYCKTSNKLFLFLLPTFIIFFLFTLPVTAFGDSAFDQVISSPALKHHQALLEYWTPERLKNAKPMTLDIEKEATSFDPSLLEQEQAGEPFSVPPAKPAGNLPHKKSSQLPTEEMETQSLPEPFKGTYPFVYTSYRLFPNHPQMYRRYPMQVIGKVFFTIPGEGDYVCSGSVVNTSSDSSVWTAGHCVYSPGIGWHTNFVFAPSRFEGTNTYSLWSALSLVTLTGWTNGMLEYDMGGAHMDNIGPYVIEDLGALGFWANTARQQHWHAIGYPAETPFDGEHQHLCQSTWAADDNPSGDPSAPYTVGMGCDMTGGSSGGPWVLDYSEWGGYLNGNVSYGYVGVPDQYYSPYFGDGAISVYDWLDSQPTPTLD